MSDRGLDPRTGYTHSVLFLSFQNDVSAGARQILAASGRGGFTLHPESLERILLADNIMDKPVVVISVAGAFRKGKSFLLDMMLRYLRASDKTNWVNEPNARGFPWQGGYRRHTTGILMWSEPFPVTLPTGEQAVILLMDTQGTFDNQSTVHESSTVFALSTLLSSLQIFNIMGNLQNDDLEHLQLFTEYGRMALDDTNTKPFQKLLFLVRDWQFAHQLQLGARGGDILVSEWLQNQSGKKELEKVRRHIRDCFSEISGFLLPHPGQKVAGSPNFDGSSNDMDPAFVAGLQELMPKILAPENLTIKTIAGNPVTAGDLYTFFGTYTNLFQSDKLPKPKNIMQATAEANNMAAAQEAKSQYIKEMECLGREDQPSLDQDQLFRKHREAATKAETAFSNRKKMGDWKTSEEYRKKLVQGMEEWFRFAEQANNTKREKERLDAENHNLGLVGTCKMTYMSEMDPVAGEDAGYVPQKDMDTAHEEAKKKAMDQYDAEKKVFGGLELESRYKLSQDIEVEFRQMIFHNDVKKDAKNHKAAQANMKAVSQAKRSYQNMMNAMTSGGVLTADELQNRHQQALQTAAEMFESLKEGDELITTGYLENMKSDIDREMDSYMRANQHRGDMAQVHDQMKLLEKQLVEARRPTPSGGFCTIL